MFLRLINLNGLPYIQLISENTAFDHRIDQSVFKILQVLESSHILLLYFRNHRFTFNIQLIL